VCQRERERKRDVSISSVLLSEAYISNRQLLGDGVPWLGDQGR
jgi:hypothetical protein